MKILIVRNIFNLVKFGKSFNLLKIFYINDKKNFKLY